MGGHSENEAICKLQEGHLPGTELAATRTLDFPVSRTVRNKFLLFIPPCQWQFVIYLHELTNRPTPTWTIPGGQTAYLPAVEADTGIRKVPASLS